MTSRGATRRSTIDATSDGRLLRLQHAVKEEEEGLEGDFSKLRALCCQARDEEADMGASQDFKIMMKDIVTKAMAMTKKNAGVLLKTSRSRNRGIFEEVETTLDKMKDTTNSIHELAKVFLDRAASPASVVAACEDARAHGVELSSTMCIIGWRCSCFQKMMFQDYEGVCRSLDTGTGEVNLVLAASVEPGRLASIAAAIVEDIIMRSLENHGEETRCG